MIPTPFPTDFPMDRARFPGPCFGARRARRGRGVAAVFIDGGYLDKLLFSLLDGARLDYARLIQRMAEPDALFRAYYYHCLPYLGPDPSPERRERRRAKARFFGALRHLPGLEVRLGHLVKRGRDAAGRDIFVQKRVDCMVGVDLALLAGKGAVTRVALLAGDEDLAPAVNAAKRLGVVVTLWHGGWVGGTAPSRELLEISDERRVLDKQRMGTLIT
jgi:uncharacterized LabA/DUF88 family protein